MSRVAGVDAELAALARDLLRFRWLPGVSCRLPSAADAARDYAATAM